jgi:RNA polymerase sigma-70 factor (ECF subfamily)
VDAAEFTALRPLLFSAAYRLLGSASDAEDVLQEAWLRAERAERAGGEIREPRAWLLRAVTNLCLDELRSARVRRERYVGPWLPEPVLTGEHVADDPLAAIERRELLSMGALLLLERLSPAERAVLVLREGLGLRHAEIARAVGLSEANSRTLLTRARRHLAGAPQAQAASPDTHQRLLAALVTAFDGGRAEPLVSLLREDVVLLSDGGGEALAARRPILGRDRVVRFFLGVRTKEPPTSRIAIRDVNGEPGLVVFDGAVLRSVASLVLDTHGLVAEVLLVIAPGKLAYAGRQAGLRPPAPGTRP